MTTLELHEVEREADVDAAPHDDGAFAAMMERHRRSLHGHCYRILQSPDQADDAVQQTLLRAWRAREGFAGRAELGSWLHKIATNVCFDELGRRQRRARPHRIRERLVPVEGCADGEPDVAAPSWAEPDGQVVTRESLAQACLTMFTLLPPKQRAVLILRDVLRWSACDTAELLDVSVAAVNSALQRARATLAGRSGRVAPVDAKLGPAELVLLSRYVDAIGRPDPAAAVAAARVDVGGATSRTQEPLQHRSHSRRGGHV